MALLVWASGHTEYVEETEAEVDAVMRDWSQDRLRPDGQRAYPDGFIHLSLRSTTSADQKVNLIRLRPEHLAYYR